MERPLQMEHIHILGQVRYTDCDDTFASSIEFTIYAISILEASSLMSTPLYLYSVLGLSVNLNINLYYPQDIYFVPYIKNDSIVDRKCLLTLIAVCFYKNI